MTIELGLLIIERNYFLIIILRRVFIENNGNFGSDINFIVGRIVLLRLNGFVIYLISN